MFFESPSNPMQELVDIAAVCDLAHDAGAKVIVDNVFGTPVFSKPLEQGADIIVYSATKHIDGQGRTLGGAILGTSEFINGPVKNLMRHTGPSMSPFNAWVLLKGLETLSLRVERMAASALEVARALEAHPKISRGALSVARVAPAVRPRQEADVWRWDGRDFRAASAARTRRSR